MGWPWVALRARRAPQGRLPGWEADGWAFPSARRSLLRRIDDWLDQLGAPPPGVCMLCGGPAESDDDLCTTCDTSMTPTAHLRAVDAWFTRNPPLEQQDRSQHT
jgi:hypothetical protein